MKIFQQDENTSARSKSSKHACHRRTTITEAIRCRELRLVTLAERRVWNSRTPGSITVRLPFSLNVWQTIKKRIAIGTILLSRGLLHFNDSIRLRSSVSKGRWIFFIVSVMGQYYARLLRNT